MPILPQNLEELYCYHNQLTTLPTLPENLITLYCYHNELTSLPTLPQNLKELYCSNNQLNSLPNLPQSLMLLDCINNPIYEIVNSSILVQSKKQIEILNNFRNLYYSLKYKKQLKHWLWEKVKRTEYTENV